MTAELAEDAVIGGAVMLESPWPIHLLELEPEDFASHNNAKTWDAIQTVKRAGDPVDIVHVYREIRKEHGAQLGVRMMELAERSPTCANLDHWASLVINDSRKRSAQRAAQGALQRIGVGDDADATIEAINDAMRQVRPAVTESGPKLIKDGMIGVLDNLEMERKNPDHGRLCRTGLPDLDEALRIRASELTIVAGRPSMGKSALAFNVAAFAASGPDGGGVYVSSLEMSREAIVERVMSSEARLRASLVSAIGSDGLNNACQRIMRMRLYIDDRPALSVEQMSAAAGKVPDLRLVVVDYLQLAKVNAKLERQDMRIGDVAKQLKNLSKSHGCHVLALSQLSRAVEQRSPPRPVLSDLRDSGNLEEHADNVLMLFRPGYYDDKEDPESAEILIRKQRNGRVGTVQARWIATAQRFLPW